MTAEGRGREAGNQGKKLDSKLMLPEPAVGWAKRRSWGICNKGKETDTKGLAAGWVRRDWVQGMGPRGGEGNRTQQQDKW